MTIRTLPELCQELLKNWPEVLNFLGQYAPTQEMQEVRIKVYIIVSFSFLHIHRVGFHRLTSFQPQSLEWSIVCDEFFCVKLELFQRIVRDCKTLPLD